MRRVFRVVGAAASGIAGAVFRGLILTASSAAAATAGGQFTEFRDKYHCEIVQRLAAIQATESEQGRYLILAMAYLPYRFVQCLFDDSGNRVLCEASSGYHTQKGGKARAFRASPEAVAELGRLGFATDDSKGNFQREMEARSHKDLEVVADLLLAAIYRAYGARPGSRMVITAPLAPATDPARCRPIG
jgi:hypothetical protein